MGVVSSYFPCFRACGPHPPSFGRKTFANRLLEEEYKEVSGRAAKQLEGKMGTLSIDGWSNLVNTPVLGLSVNEWLIDTIDTSGKPHTGEYLKEVMAEGLFFPV